ncbi:hypothetical protein [Nitrosovibrio sp. Nv4]|nr:hypothetical protein [Nitrosovibrio sp. Nv4]
MTSYLNEGNAEPLAQLLRSEKRLTPELRIFVADIIEGKIKKKVGENVV